MGASAKKKGAPMSGRNPQAVTSAAAPPKRMPQENPGVVNPLGDKFPGTAFLSRRTSPPRRTAPARSMTTFGSGQTYTPRSYTPGTYTPGTFRKETEFTPGEYTREAPAFRGTGFTEGEYVAPERSYGGGIPPEAQELADALQARGEMLNRRTMESELLGFGGQDEVSSPMARFQALREGELTGELNNTVLGLLQQSAEAGRQRRHEAGMQDTDIASRHFMQGEQLGTERNIQNNRMMLEQALSDAAMENQRFMQGEELGTRRYISDAANELQRYLTGEELGTRRFLTGEELGTRRYLTNEQLGSQRFMQGREIDSRHILDSLSRRERYDDREIAERNKLRDMMMQLYMGSPTQTGSSKSVGVGYSH